MIRGAAGRGVGQKFRVAVRRGRGLAIIRTYLTEQGGREAADLAKTGGFR